jgi:hypothetical protein
VLEATAARQDPHGGTGVDQPRRLRHSERPKHSLGEDPLVVDSTSSEAEGPRDSFERQVDALVRRRVTGVDYWDLHNYGPERARWLGAPRSHQSRGGCSWIMAAAASNGR